MESGELNAERKVFVVSRGNHDWSRAERYGEVVFLSEEAVNRTDISNMMRRFEPILRKQSQKYDFIVITGLSVMNAIACTIFGRLHGRLNLLMFDSENDRYIRRELVFYDEKECVRSAV
jgi:hypothetical protein